MNRADLLLHPVRLRIVLALAGDELTTGELADRLTDVPQATLYRQVAALLEVASERRNRGGVERTYRLIESAASLGPEDVSEMSPAQHLEGITSFVGSLLESAARYLQSGDAKPGADVFGYRLIPMWLNDEEAEQLTTSLGDVIRPYLDNGPEDRRRILLNTVFIPDANAQ